MTHIVDNKGRIILSGCFILNENKEILLLHRKDHNHYETPGGKANIDECEDPNDPSEEELRKIAEREVYEELGSDISLAPLEYFGSVEFTVPDGRIAVANKFLTKILSGEPQLAEPEVFDRFDYISIIDLENKNISSDLKLFLDKLNLQS